MPNPFDEAEKIQKSSSGNSGVGKNPFDMAEEKAKGPSTLQKIGKGALDFVGGVGAGALSTVAGAADLATKATNLPAAATHAAGAFPSYTPPPSIKDNPWVKKQITPPESLPGKVGFHGEQIGEMFLAPEASEARLAQLARGSKLGESALRVGQEAAKVGGTEYLQTGGDAKQAAIGALTAGGVAGLGEALRPAIKAVGRGIQMSTIRPSRADVKDGFKWSTLDRFKLKGNLEDSYNQVDNELTRLRTERNKLIAPGTTDVDLTKPMNTALLKLRASTDDLKLGAEGLDAVKEASQMIMKLGKIIKDPRKVDISKVENLKEYMGTLGAWADGARDDKGKVTATVANIMYNELRQVIEDSTAKMQGAQVKILNSQMKDLIPVKNAILKRLPVEQRNSALSLTDMLAAMPAIVSGNPAELGLLALSRGQKSARLGNALVRGGKPIPGSRLLGRGAAEAEKDEKPDENP